MTRQRKNTCNSHRIESLESSFEENRVFQLDTLYFVKENSRNYLYEYYHDELYLMTEEYYIDERNTFWVFSNEFFELTLCPQI